jgi:hypothetical protein
MKKNVMMVIALVISTVAFAQVKQNGHRNAGGQSDKMKQVLSLSDEQYASVKSVNQKYAEKFKELRKDGGTSRDDFRTLQQERRAEINAVLTEAQQQSWKEYRAEQRAQHKKSFDSRKQDRMEKMKTSLELSDDQVKKLQDVNRKSAEQRKALMSDTALTKEEKKAKFRALSAEQDAAVKGILSPEQYEKWKNERTAHRGKQKRGR